MIKRDKQTRRLCQVFVPINTLDGWLGLRLVVLGTETELPDLSEPGNFVMALRRADELEDVVDAAPAVEEMEYDFSEPASPDMRVGPYDQTAGVDPEWYKSGRR
jgi:hypothetical protein